MEWLNGEVRGREKVMRGLKKMDIRFFKDINYFITIFNLIWHGIERKDTGWSCGIEIKNGNKWKIVIENAMNNERSI